MITALYVDDEPGLLEITKLFLENSKDFIIDTSTSAREVLASGNLSKYDAIISDYQMPGMDGIAFLKAVREQFGDIPFILFTGRGREEVVIDAINNGADFYLQKGGDPAAQFAELKHKIRQAVTRRQAELLRTESEKRLADIINFLPDATFAIDRSGHVIAWNRATEEMTGVPASEMLGKGNYEYAIPFYGTRRKILIDLIFEPNDIIAKNYAHIIHDKDILIADTSLPRPKGKTVTLMGKASPLYDRKGNITGAIESIRDITERKNAEDALLHAKKDWETIFRAIGHPAFVLDPHNRILDANDATVRATGMALEDLRGKCCYEVFHKPGTTRPPGACPCEKLRKTGRTETEEIEVEGLNGYYAVTCTPVFDDDGRLEKVLHIAMDITERRKTQEELRAAYEQLAASEEELRGQYDALAASEQRIRESEATYRTIFEATGTATVVIENDGTISLANAEFEHLSGCSRNETENRKKWMEFVVPEDLERMRAQHRLRRTDPEKALKHYEFRFITRSGGIREIFLTIDLIPGTTKSIASLLDITERKRTEDRLIRANQEYTDLLSQIQDVYYLSDAEGKLIRASRSFAAVLGFDDLSECLGRNIAEDFYFNPAERKQFLDEVNLHGKVTNYEVRVKKKDGTPVLVETSSHLYLDADGNVLGIEGTFRDVTERKRAAEALRESEEKYRGIFENTTVAVFRTRPDGSIETANPAFARLLGYETPEKAIQGIPHMHRIYVTPGVRDTIFRDLASRGSIQDLEVALKRQDGGIIWVSANLRAVYDNGGKIVGVDGLAVDITERINAQESLRQANIVVENSSVVLFRWKAEENWPVAYVSQNVAQFGYSPEDLLSGTVPYSTLVHPDDLGRVAREVQEYSERGTGQFPQEYRIVARDGRIRWIDDRTTIERDAEGKITHYQGIVIDITDRRKAEEELRSAYERIAASEEELRSQFNELAATQDELQKQQQQLAEVANMVPGVIFQFYARPDGTRGLYYVSRRASEVFGFPDDAGDFYAWFIAHIDPRDRDAFLSSNDEVIASGSPWDFEGRFIKPSGETIWFQGMSRPVRRENELVFNGVLLDITDRKHAEAAIRENEEKYRTLVETTDTGFVIVDAKGNVLDANPEYVRLTGHTYLAEIAGRNVLEWTAEYEKEKNEQAVQQCVRDGFIRNFEIDYTSAAGTITPIEINATVLESGEGIRILTLCRDISERRRADAALQESEERYRIFVETADEGIWSINAGFITTFTNRKMQELFGYRAEEMLGRPVWDFIPPEEAESMKSALYERRTGKPGRYERRWKRKDGTDIWCLTSATPLFSREGKFVGSFGMFTDITERRRMDEALRESEEKYRAILENVQDVMYRSDRDGNLIMASPSFTGLLGYDSLDECIGKNIASRFWMYPELRQEFLAAMQETGSISCYEIILKKKDGMPVIVSASSHFYYAKDGTVAGVEGIFHDITEKRQAQEHVRLLAELNDISPASVIVHTPDGEMLYANQRTFDLHGWTRDELMALNLHELDVPESEHQIEDRIEKLRKTGETSFDVEHFRKDGSRFPLHVNTKVTRWNDREVILSVSTDISERKSVENALRESEAKVQSILHGSPVLQFVIDTDHRVISWNRAIEGYSGIVAADIIGTDQQWRAFYPEKRPVLADLLVEGNTDGLFKWYGGKLQKSRYVDGAYESLDFFPHMGTAGKWLSFTAAPIRDAGGSVIGAVETLEDVTEQRNLENAISEVNRKLTLLNSITRHDVINQLTVLQGYARIAALRESDPVIADLLAKIEANAQTISRQIEFTKTYQDLGIHTPDWHRLDDIIERTKRGEVAYSGTCLDAEVYADTLLDRVFTNLFDNAIRHGERVTGISVRCERAPDGLVIIIEDDGVGIPPENKDKIFEKGYGKYTGFGLFLAKEILAITGITIRETGYQGIGARFEILVPEGKFRFVQPTRAPL